MTVFSKNVNSEVMIMNDLAIIGAGPAGLSAAVYATRAGLSVVLIEGAGIPSGQVLTTYEVENYLGFPTISGFDLGAKFQGHAEAMGVEIQYVSVENIVKTDDGFILNCGDSEISAKCVLVTTGAQNRKLEVEGEQKFAGRGVSYCATCDGAFFKGKTVAVVGGSYTAVEDAIYLASMCEKVYVIHRRDNLRAGKFLESKLFAFDNVEFRWNSVVSEIVGDQKLSGIVIDDINTKKSETIEVSGVFVAIGTTPKTDLLKEIVKLDKHGYVIADETCATSLEGLYAAGDLRTKPLRQIITAVSDGANAATSIWNYLLHKNSI